MAVVKGTNNSETLNGSHDSDVIYGYGGDDTLIGGRGRNTLIGGEGADFLNGLYGLDTASYADSDEGVFVSLRSGSGIGGTAQGDTFLRIENITGSNYSDVLIGDDWGGNDLKGLGGDDTLMGGGGDDDLRGGEGNDMLKGGGGADTLAGNAGVDMVAYDQSPTGVIVSLAQNVGSLGDADGDSFFGVENLAGSAYGDMLEGDDNANVINGLDGVDEMIGRSGSDTYYVDNSNDSVVESGGQGQDEVRTSVTWWLTDGADVETLRTTNVNDTAAIGLYGNASGNVIFGNAGNNSISGGAGEDELWGLGGEDRFLFLTALDAATNVDTIVDFNPAQDSIGLNLLVFATLDLGPLPAEQFAIGSAAQEADDRIIYDSNTGALVYDSDGVEGAAAVQFAELDPGLNLTHQDFIGLVMF